MRTDIKTSAQPGACSWREIAASAYMAYAASTGNKNFRGDPMPEFDALPQAIQTAWEAAVRHAECVNSVGQTFDLTDAERARMIDPARWAGWVPPHVT